MKPKNFFVSLIGVLYIPVFFAAWILNLIARLLLFISYIGLVEPKRAACVYNALFTWPMKDKL